MDTPWRIELLGRLRASQGGRVVDRFRSRKAAALLAYLAFYRGPAHSRGKLIELLWPESPPEAGQRNLRVELASLRRQLEPPGLPAGAVILADRLSVQLSPAAVTTDVAQFEADLRAGARAGTPAEQVRQLAAAVEIYRGELLPGFHEEWLLPERQRLSQLFLQALRQLSSLQEQAGDRAQALQWAGRAVAADPLWEEGQYELIRLLAADGQPEAALRQYQELKRLLQPLGSAPRAETCALARQIRDGATGRQEGARGRGGEGATDPGSAEHEPAHDFAGALPHSPTPSPPHPSTALPSGTVTFLLTDIEGHTPLWERTGEAFHATRESHHQLLRQLFRRHGGHEVKEMGDGFVVVFQWAPSALACALEAQRALSAHAWPAAVGPLRVRMALYTGDVEPMGGEYYALALNYASRVANAGNGGQILCSEETASLLRGSLESGVGLVDLGNYRLRSVAKPARLFQVNYPGMTQAEFPPLRVPRAVPGYLPPQWTRFIGREQEIARLGEMLFPRAEGRGMRDEGKAVPSHPSSLVPRPSRLVTLTGPGGTGKTRLAHEVARSLWEPFNEAVWFVSLADLADARLIADRTLEAMGLPRSTTLSPLEQVSAVLSEQPSLLLLDNFEHLVAEGASLVRTLLERVETLTVLVTSRQRLNLTGERVVRVRPLPIPGVQAFGRSGVGEERSADPNARTPERLKALAQCPSVQLFVDRAQAVDVDFQVTEGNAAAVAALCEKLEGLPLALELAAARAGVLTPAQILAQLSRPLDFLVSRQRDVGPRQKSMRLAFSWSYQLLTPELRQFFARLSVFRGGWTLDAAEAVCLDSGVPAPPFTAETQSGAEKDSSGRDLSLQPSAESPRLRGDAAAGPIQNTETLEHLSQLLASTLIIAEAPEARPGSWRAPPPGGETQAPEMRYRFLEIVREYAAEQLSPEEQEYVSRRHAAYYLALAERAGTERTGAAPGEWLDRLEREHDNLRAALDWAAARREVDVGLRLGGALWHFWEVRGYRPEARERLAGLLAQAESAPRESGDPGRDALRARALHGLGVVAYFQGDYAAAHAALQESLGIGRRLGDKRTIADCLRRLADVICAQGEYATARALFEQTLAIETELRDRPGIANSLSGLAWLAREHGDLKAARSLDEQSLAIRRELNGKPGIAYSLNMLGETCYFQGDLSGARRCLAESLEIWREVGDKGGIAWSLWGLGCVADLQGDYGEAQSLQEQSLAMHWELEDKWAIAGSLNSLGRVKRHQGDGERALALCRESLALAWKQGNKRCIAECLEGVAEAAAAIAALQAAPAVHTTCSRPAVGAAERATRLFGAAASLRDTIGSPLPPVYREDHEHSLAAARAILGEAAFAAAWAEGRAMELEQAVAYALDMGIHPR